MTSTRTARLELRSFRPDDGAAIFAYLAHPDAVRFEPYPMPSRDEADAIAIARARDDRFVAVCRRDGLLIGNLYRAPEGPPAWNTWQIGYVFGPDHWGHGYATEAVAQLIRDMFDERGAHRVVARCDTRNERSWRLLERLGMRREAHVLQAATFRNDDAGQPVWHDAYHYALVESDEAVARRPGPA